MDDSRAAAVAFAGLLIGTECGIADGSDRADDCQQYVRQRTE
jgi:hypothetical protein